MVVAVKKQTQGKKRAGASGIPRERLTAPELAKLLLTVEETAHKLSVGRSAVYGLMRRGELRYIVVGRVRRVPVDAVSEYVSRALSSSSSSSTGRTFVA